MNMLQKTIIAVFTATSLLVSSVAYAASTNESTSIPTVQVTDRSLSSTSWSQSVSVSGGEQLSVQLHYYLAAGDSATDMRFSLEDLDGKTFEAGTEVVTGSVKADNVSASNGSATVIFTEKVKLDLYNVSWQKGGCSSVGCETSLVESAGNVLTSNGMSIGNVEGYTGNNWNGRHYNGNVIVTFRTTKIDGPVDPGDPDAPTVTTNSATSVDQDSAVLNGYVDFTDDVDSGQVYFQYGTTSGNLSNSTSQVTRSADGSFAQSITGLQDDQVYYFRAVTRGDDNNLYYGSTRSFTTDEDGGNTGGNDEVSVQTNSATSVDQDSARLNGEITEGDNAEAWFAFDENDETPSCSDSSQEENVSGSFDDGDEFGKVVTGLDENEEYFYRACARGDDGDIVSGSIRSFSTDEDDNNNDNDNVDADVDTLAASSVDEDSARLNGEITDGDNVEAWFVYSTNATPSCTSSTGKVSVSGSFDDGDEFGKVVTGLRDNTKYYFRACALGDDGERVSGAIRNFTTDEDGDNNDDDDDDTSDISVVTRIASGITTNSATVRSFVEGQGNGVCFFQYGTTTGFGNATNRVSIDLDDVTECSANLTGLRSNTGYFYRAVLEADGQTAFGGTQSFRTNSIPTLPPVTPPPTPSNPNPEPVRPQGPVEIMKWVASESDPEFETFVRASREEPVFYRVRITNTTDETLEDVTVIDRIPFYLELDTEERLDDDSEKQIRWFLTRLQPGETKTYITEMRVRDDAREGDEIESYASASNDDFSVTSNDVVIEVEGDNSDTVNSDEDNNDNQAAFIFGAGFFPTTLVGWLLLFVVVLAMAYLISRILFSRNENKKVLEELRVMQK